MKKIEQEREESGIIYCRWKSTTLIMSPVSAEVNCRKKKKVKICALVR